MYAVECTSEDEVVILRERTVKSFYKSAGERSVSTVASGVTCTWRVMRTSIILLVNETSGLVDYHEREYGRLS